ncbi:helix-turn-helix domain-containing protein [Marivirga arenosa]|uniref:Helix-turn-helix domain-containing protein n=1 Tax=Marivirga arenosa TaxID=3059076 RepID=A0AA51ZV25_9BACT|nr:helix-turn-helix domain-containing protein [Marivirga sp. BKB1-2]WNB17172.1 helix-turn-helix domain-containing protein [Marivirga sp. BKB1-2]
MPQQKLTELANLAVKYVNTTNRLIFLTGKAGSGKTTLLRHIIKNTYKNVAVAAPTGIAAINAKGVTLHSLLQLPFGTFIPDDNAVDFSRTSEQIHTPRTFLQQFKMYGNKRQIIRNLELLIIDEVSMLRADILDCMDLVLRTVRKNPNPFGGLQIMFIGDLNQLPPVIKQYEWQYLNHFYNTGYFFEALAIQKSEMVYIELDKIFRQSDPEFTSILNRLRDNHLTKQDLKKLNEHYVEDAEESTKNGYIHITTHNNKADLINEKALKSLSEDETNYTAEIEGDFPENMYPIPAQLNFKLGAQVMFIKNDSSGDARYFNGKIGEISELNEDTIKVKLKDPEDEVTVERYEWLNQRYSLDKATNELEEKWLGTFKQFPLKLAWAITVHKSQGLTFEKAILDLSDSFAPGQMYVALSRLTSLDGLILSKPVHNITINLADTLKNFEQKKVDSSELKKNLASDQKRFLFEHVREAYNFQELKNELSHHFKSFNKNENRSLKQQYAKWTHEKLESLNEINKIGLKFQSSLAHYEAKSEYLQELEERVHSAESYFKPKLKDLYDAFKAHLIETSKQDKVKSYLKEIESITELLKSKILQISKTGLLVNSAVDNRILTKSDLNQSAEYADAKKNSKKSKPKKDKTPTAEISFNLYKEGNSIDQIANKRGFVEGTILGHLSKYIESGDIDVTELIDPVKLDQICQVMALDEVKGSADVKARLGDEFTYDDIKIAWGHFRKNQAQNAEN